MPSSNGGKLCSYIGGKNEMPSSNRHFFSSVHQSTAVVSHAVKPLASIESSGQLSLKTSTIVAVALRSAIQINIDRSQMVKGLRI